MVKEVKQRIVEKFLASKGWQLVRTKGGHNVWRSPDGKESLAIPRHGTVTAGVVAQVIKKLPDTPANWR